MEKETKNDTAAGEPAKNVKKNAKAVQCEKRCEGPVCVIYTKKSVKAGTSATVPKTIADILVARGLAVVVKKTENN